LHGKPYSDPAAGMIWKDWEKSLVSTESRVEDGENYQDIILRSDNALEYLFQRPEKTLVVVSHSYFIRTLIVRILSGDELSPALFGNLQRSASIENTGVSVIIYKQGRDKTSYWKLLVHNDYSHLPGL